MPVTAVSLPVIEQIFAVLDRLEISREAVVIPLKPAVPGGVTRLANGKLQIVVDGARELDDWLPELESLLRAAVGRPA